MDKNLVLRMGEKVEIWIHRPYHKYYPRDSKMVYTFNSHNMPIWYPADKLDDALDAHIDQGYGVVVWGTGNDGSNGILLAKFEGTYSRKAKSK